MGGALVTVVVATWNRPDALSAAVRSVLRQTCPDWRLLVVGDACDERTGQALAAVADPRVTFVNLPERTGEQSGPNSVGMALADTPFVALLNHDDVWLPDHLERALARLEHAELCIGRTARASTWQQTPWGVEPVFQRRSPRRRRIAQAFHDAEDAFEPCSTWVFRRELVDRVGPWRPAHDLYRVPAEDWLLRAWRAGARIVFDQEITALYLLTHYRSSREDGCYAAPSPVHLGLEARLARTSTEDLRAEIEATTPDRKRSPLSHALHKPLRAALVNRLSARLYLRTGIDAFAWYALLSGRGRGRRLRRASVRRTGAALPPTPDRERLLAAARRQLALEGA